MNEEEFFSDEQFLDFVTAEHSSSNSSLNIAATVYAVAAAVAGGGSG